MAYCINCGTEIIDGAKFCQKCGSPVSENTGSQSKREQVFEGKLYKCPNCGEVLKSFTRNCPSCGMELRGTKATSSVREFALKLEAIEAKREYEKPGLFSKLKNKERVSKTDEQKISLIKSFSVPNTKEDMLEFMILATSNIDATQYGQTEVENKANRAVADAWNSKIQQVYAKAKNSYGDNDDFARIQELYDSCNREIKRQKKIKKIKWAALIGWLPLMLIIVFGLGAILGPRADAEEEARLEAIVNDVEIALEEGDYRLALRTAESIEYDASDEERERWWNVKRETLIDEIIEEAEQNGVHLERSTKTDSTTEGDSGGFVEGFKEAAYSDEAQENIDEFKRIMSEESDSGTE